MNISKISLTFLALSIFASVCLSQEKPQSNLLLETKFNNCEELKVSVNLLFQEKLIKDKDLTGHIIIYGDPTKRLTSYFTEQILRNFISYFKYDSQRVVFNYAKDDSFKVEFWTVSSGADLLSFQPDINYDYNLPKMIKPLIFYDENNDNMAACDTYPFNYDRLFAKVLGKNKGLIGQIIIKENTKKEFLRRRTEILHNLTKIFNVPLQRLKVSFVKTNKKSTNVIYRLTPNNLK